MTISQAPVSKTAMSGHKIRFMTLAVFVIRWYIRVISLLLTGYALFLWGKHPPLVELWLNEGPLVALGLAGIGVSFGVKENWLMGTISLFIALFSGLLLFTDGVIGGLTSTIIAIGLDPLRAQLIAALVMTAGTALLGAALVTLS